MFASTFDTNGALGILLLIVLGLAALALLIWIIRR